MKNAMYNHIIRSIRTINVDLFLAEQTTRYVVKTED
jgi:hypothetical protein